MQFTKPVIIVSALALAACSEQPPGQESMAAPDTTEAVALQAPASMSCPELSAWDFPNTRITSVESIGAGAFNPPATAGPGGGPDYSNLPAFCRVTGSIHPTVASDIRFEMWLPTENWNGRFMQTGNGGAAGSIVQGSLANPLLRGYAVANTDTGHQGGGGDFSWALGEPEKLTDYAWRAIHELTVTGKALTRAHYGSDPEKSYFVGCSTGGRQGLMEAQRFPEDYDAIVAGAPASNWNLLQALSIVIQNNLGENGLAPVKLGLLKAAAVASCDALDGVEDGVITNVAQCNFDPGSLQCEDGQAGQCLAEDEVQAARRLYAGVADSAGQTLFPGTGYGSEPLWAAYASPGFAIGTSYFRNVVTGNPNWDPSGFDVNTHLAMSDSVAAEMVAMDPDISAFTDNGGKLITYHGTADGLIPFGNSVNYFNSMLAALGEAAVAGSIRYYQVPGMSHCSGGDGAYAVDWLAAMEAWVEDQLPPGTLAGTHPAPPPGAPVTGEAFTRPICAYPEMPVYLGNGDVNNAENFSCAAP